MIALSFLLGMLHIKEDVDSSKNFSDKDMIPEEAIQWMVSRLSMTKDDYYNNIGDRARYRAFTVARLTSLDAIERTKNLLTRSIEEGETTNQWYERLKSDEILKKIGFHEENPFYLETVFRTNTISAYNAGRWKQIQDMKDDIYLLEYIATEDSRTTEICQKLDGVKLPPNDPFWNTYYPPNHFNCRSLVRTISKEEAEIYNYKETKNFPDILPGEGFQGSIANTWWQDTESMIKREKEYGIWKEIDDRKKRLLKNIKNNDIKKFPNKEGENNKMINTEPINKDDIINFNKLKKEALNNINKTIKTYINKNKVSFVLISGVEDYKRTGYYNKIIQINKIDLLKDDIKEIFEHEIYHFDNEITNLINDKDIINEIENIRQSLNSKIDKKITFETFLLSDGFKNDRELHGFFDAIYRGKIKRNFGHSIAYYNFTKNRDIDEILSSIKVIKNRKDKTVWNYLNIEFNKLCKILLNKIK